MFPGGTLQSLLSIKESLKGQETRTKMCMLAGALFRIVSSFCGDIFGHSRLFYNFLHKMLFLLFKIIVFEFWLSFANKLAVWCKILQNPTVLYQLSDSWLWYGMLIVINIRCGKRKKLHIWRYSSIFLEEQSKITESASIVGPQQHFESGLSWKQVIYITLIFCWPTH